MPPHLDLALDPDSPIPLFHQIAESIRYSIAVGKLRSGDLLPTIRTAGDELGVHYLTVRKAYGALEEEGLVERRRGVGTRVTGGNRPEGAGVAIHVVECNAPQATDYAGQIATATGMPVGTWLLDDPGRPPDGHLIGTYFHFNEIREHWPDRARDVRFVAVAPDPAIVERLPRARREGCARIRLCETRATRAHNVIPDLTGLLDPERFALEPTIVDHPAAILEDPDPTPILFSPRLWARLDPASRPDPRAHLLRYLVDAEDLAALRARVQSDSRADSKAAS